MSVVLAVLSSLLWGTSDFLGGTATRRLRVAVVVGGSQAMAFTALLLVATATGQLDDVLEHPSHLLPGVAAGVIGATALGAFYAALAQGTMGVIAPIAAMGTLLPVGVGLARGEVPSPLQLVGIAVAIIGVVLASGPELSGGASPKPLLLAIGAALGFGTVAILLARGAAEGGVGVLGTVLTMRATSTAMMLLLALALLTTRREIGPRPSGRDLAMLAVIGLVDVGANASFAGASQHGLLSVVSVLGSLYPVVTVLLARQVHRESLVPIQAAGVVAALAGVALLAAG